MSNLTILGVQSRRHPALPRIDSRKTGEFFAMGYHSVDEILSGAPFSLYVKLPISQNSRNACGIAECIDLRGKCLALNLRTGSTKQLDDSTLVIPLLVAANITVNL